MNMTTIRFEELYLENSRNGIYKSNEYFGSGVAIVKMSQQFDNRFIHSDLPDYEFIQLNEKESELYNLAVNDLLFSRTSVVPEGVGKCSIVKYLNAPLVFESNIIRVRLNDKLTNPEFIFRYFQTHQGRSNILAIAGGTSVKTIKSSALKELLIPNPKIDFQNKIVSILSAYDDLIENNRQRIQLLEESVRLLYREWFVNLRFPGHEHVKIKDGVPEGWERNPLGEICYQYKKSVMPSDMPEGTPYIGIEHIPRRSITLDTWEYADKVESSKFAFEERDILFGKIRPYFHKVGFAICKGITSSDTIVIRSFEQLFYYYVLMFVSSDYFIALASKTVKEGSKMPRADWGHLIKQNIIIPSKQILLSFNEQIDTITQQLNTLALYNRKLTEARDLLLPRLMNGEIEV